MWYKRPERVIDNPRQKHFFDRDKDATCRAACPFKRCRCALGDGLTRDIVIVSQ